MAIVCGTREHEQRHPLLQFSNSIAAVSRYTGLSGGELGLAMVLRAGRGNQSTYILPFHTTVLEAQLQGGSPKVLLKTTSPWGDGGIKAAKRWRVS